MKTLRDAAHAQAGAGATAARWRSSSARRSSAVFFVAEASPGGRRRRRDGGLPRLPRGRGPLAETAGGETMTLTVSRKELESSVHRGVGCRGCHRGINLDDHPGDRKIASLAEYRREVSKSCLGCHAGIAWRSGRSTPRSRSPGPQVSCVECHGAHAVRDVVAAKAGLELNAYCLGCHARAITRSGAAGAVVSLVVDPAQLKGSVHSNHSCADCHAAFGKDAPPGRRRPGDQRLTAAQACSRCHGDKMKQAAGSIHFSLLRAGPTEPRAAPTVTARTASGRRSAMRPSRACPAAAATRRSSTPTRAACTGRPGPRASTSTPRSAWAATRRTTSRARGRARSTCGGLPRLPHRGRVAARRLAAERGAAPGGRLLCGLPRPEAERVVALRFVDERTGRAFSEPSSGSCSAPRSAGSRPAGRRARQPGAVGDPEPPPRAAGRGVEHRVSARLEVAAGSTPTVSPGRGRRCAPATRATRPARPPSARWR